MAIFSRGFFGRRSAADVKLPPGQYLTSDFSVLSAGPTPYVALDQWEFKVDNGTDVLRRWDCKSFRELPTEKIRVDLHCVTRWSKLGTFWEGVSLDVLLAGVKTDSAYAMMRSCGDYTTNLPLKVPLMAMIRSRAASGNSALFRLLYSVRQPGAVFYGRELQALSDRDRSVIITYAYTQVAPKDWPRPPRRIDAALIANASWPANLAPACSICGPTSFCRKCI